MKTLRLTVLAVLLGVSSVTYAQDPEPTTPAAPPAEAQPEVKPDGPTEEVAPDTPEVKPEVTPEVKPEEPKPKEESRPEVKPEPKVVAPEPAPEPAPVPAVVVEDQPEKAKPVFDFSARLRPRLVLRGNNGFGLNPDERNYNRGDNWDLGTLQARLAAKATYGTLSTDIMLQYAGRNGLFGGNQLTDPNIGVHVASVQWQAHEMFKLQLGRFLMNYGGQRVIGAVGYHQVGRAWDGGRVFITPTKKIKVDVFGAKYRDELLPEQAVYTGDAFFSGAYATYKDDWGLVDLYGLYDYRSRADDQGNERTLVTLGGRGKGGFSIVDVEVEGAYQPGSACVADMNGCTDASIDTAGWFFDSEVGVGVKNDKTKYRGYLGFSMASGDDPDTEKNEAYNQLYPTGHKWLGRMDIIGPRTNVQEIRAGFGWKYWITHGRLTYHDFSRLQPEAKRVGGEVDLTVWFHLVDGLDFEAVYGLFLPDSGLSNNDTDPSGVAHWTSLTAVAKF